MLVAIISVSYTHLDVYKRQGLYIEVPPTGSKRWRFKYRINGKEKRISLGIYPEIGLKDAREKRDERCV